jgi:hypothetical protein
VRRVAYAGPGLSPFERRLAAVICTEQYCASALSNLSMYSSVRPFVTSVSPPLGLPARLICQSTPCPSALRALRFMHTGSACPSCSMGANCRMDAGVCNSLMAVLWASGVSAAQVKARHLYALAVQQGMLRCAWGQHRPVAGCVCVCGGGGGLMDRPRCV